MDRLYSQYPGGVVGLALLLLRIVIGSWLTWDCVSRWIANPLSAESAIQIVIGVLLAALAVLLVFGLRTSLVVIASAGLLVAAQVSSRVSGGQSWFYAVTSVSLCFGRLAWAGRLFPGCQIIGLEEHRHFFKYEELTRGFLCGL